MIRDDVQVDVYTHTSHGSLSRVVSVLDTASVSVIHTVSTRDDDGVGGYVSGTSAHACEINN